MFSPEMMKMAQDMMSKMSPEQMAQMQRQMASMPPDMMQQAMNMAQQATPEQLRQMQAASQNLSGEDIAAQAAAATEQLGAQQKYKQDAAVALKAEGNKLHGARQWQEAAAKYELALTNLEGQTSSAAATLRTSCQSNLASCFLQLQRWQQCVDMCGTVLAADPNNRKALYRRGQALCALGRYDPAVDDLRQAVRLSPESEKDIIREKLAEAKQGQHQASQGVVIEEVTEPASADTELPAVAVPAVAPAAKQQREGLAESDADEDVLPLEEEAAVPAPVPAAAAAPTAAATAASLPPFGGMGVPPGMDPEKMRQASEMMKNNPDMARQAAAAMSAMSDEQLAAMVAQSGMPGLTPEMAKQAAAMMRTTPPEQLAAMAGAATGAGMPAAGGFAPPPPAAAAMAAAGAPGSEEQMRAASEALKQNPEALKQAAAMLENMSEEQLKAMAAAMPGGMGAQMDVSQMKMAAKMMSGMSPEDMERMTRMAAAMGPPPAMGTAAALGAGDSDAAGGAAVAAPAAGAAAGVGPAAGGFGAMASSMPPEMMADMRKRMQDPETLKMMKGMLKGMDPEGLASMMKQSGMNVTPEQARQMVDKLDKVSDKHLELIARLMAWFNAVLDAYRRAKAWVMSQGGLAVAVLVLLMAVLLRWLGWI